MDNAEIILAKEARKWVSTHKKYLVYRFADPLKYLSQPEAVSIFMAGSPGAGKTEFSKRIILSFNKTIVRIDPDDIREIIPGYDGKKSYIMQSACALGVEKLLDSCFHNKQDFLLDGILVDYEKSCENIRRCLKYQRDVQIFYIYQDPLIAWDFTKKREVVEGRNISKEVFIFGFLRARDNVNRIKNQFGNQVHLHVVLKNYQNGDEKFWLDVDNIDNYVTSSYTEIELKNIIV